MVVANQAYMIEFSPLVESHHLNRQPGRPAQLPSATHLVVLSGFEQLVGSFLKQRRVRAVDELGGHGTSWHVGKHEAEAKLFVLLVDILEFGDGDAALPQADAHAPLQTTRGRRLLRGSRFLPRGEGGILWDYCGNKGLEFYARRNGRDLHMLVFKRYSCLTKT